MGGNDLLKYTICFIKQGEQILMLNREKSPNMGMWNGVGGKIEDRETHLQSVIRETFEETGIQIIDPTYAGEVIWISNRGNGGMYAYLVDFPINKKLEVPLITIEGILNWKNINWILDDMNNGVVSNLKYYLPAILEGNHNLKHQFVYENGVILDYKKIKI